MNNDLVKEIAKKYALQNAISYNGKANFKAVAGKIIAELKNKEISPKEIFEISNSVCNQINKISIENQKKELEKIAPELLKKEKKERDFTLPFSASGNSGKV